MNDKARWENLALRMRSLALFRSLLAHTLPARLLDLLEGLSLPVSQRVGLYAAFMEELYAQGGDFGNVLKELTESSATAADYTRASGKSLSESMERALLAELAVLTDLSAIEPDALAAAVQSPVPLPGFASTRHDFAALYVKRLDTIRQHGYGDFARWHMFTLGEGPVLRPVKNADSQRLADLYGYERERKKILVNTNALLANLPANNILLYGDAGTGKSSTVKALANEYRAEGLRLVEVRKSQMYELPRLMDMLAENPLKFILFIDDLSFSSQEGDFAILKAILEGNISARPGNVVVYATSNRRHMLREHHFARQGDELHLNDTLEEEASLAARFGLTVVFSKPDKDLYAEITEKLAKKAGLQISPEELCAAAESYAIRVGGRSPRAAKQFIDYLQAEML